MTPAFSSNSGSLSLGIIGGLGALGGTDIYTKLIKNSLITKNQQCGIEISMRQHHFMEPDIAGHAEASLSSRKFYVFNLAKEFEKQSVNSILLPCFLSHTFLDEIQAEISVPIANMMNCLYQHIKKIFPSRTKIGILTSDYVKTKALFEHYFPSDLFTLLYPAHHVQTCLMQTIYGVHGIKSGYSDTNTQNHLLDYCNHLIQQGAELILPGFTEISIMLETLDSLSVPIIDTNMIYAQYATSTRAYLPSSPFKIGIAGGVGPAATVDFMQKIVRNTPADCDQDHIKIIVEQNPQIPDRTAHLTAAGTDPTIALYATCKKLEANKANLIAIPCNTAHAFVEQIQTQLSIPIVNMLAETAHYIQTHLGSYKKIGLLATDGTIMSRIYHTIFQSCDSTLTLHAPSPEFQKMVMKAIYGPQGVKAGFIQGQCKNAVHKVMEHMVVTQGCEILILGCTELPLLFAQNECFPIAGKTIALLDPAEILARKCIELARH